MAIFKNIDWKNVDYGTGSFLISWHLLVFIGLPIYLFFRTPSIGLIITAIVLLFATGMAITAGYHRLYTHKAYQVNKFGEVIILFFGTIAMQSSVAYWAHKHRLHHRFVDTVKDPHNIKQGFGHAHILWLFKKQIPIDWSIIRDIEENKLTNFQHKHYHKLNFGLNILVFLILGWIFSDYWGAFLIGWVTRVFVLSHSTYFVNSLAHMWGAKSYSKEQTAVNNAVVAFLTFGEGYHNYHHVFSSDYRNGIRWFQYDPTKWSIWLMSQLGIANNLKSVDKYTSKNKMIMEDKYIYLEALRKSTYEKKHALESKVVEISRRITSKVENIKQSLQEYKELRRTKARKSVIKAEKKKIKELNLNINHDWRSWRRLEKEISRHATLHHHH